MKFKTRLALKSKEGEEKIVRKFLFLPTSFENDIELRWLENANIVYQVRKIDLGDHFHDYHWKWVPVRFATDKDLKELPFEDSDLFIERKIKSPVFWLSLDTLALACVFFDMKTSITFFIAIKIMQVISYLSLQLFTENNLENKNAL